MYNNVHLPYFFTRIKKGILLALLSSITLGALISAPTYAEPVSFAVKSDVVTSAKKRIYAQYLKKCMTSGSLNSATGFWNSTLGQDNVQNFQWFKGDSGRTHRPHLAGSDAYLQCDKPDDIKAALSALGIGDSGDNAEKALCQIGLRKEGQNKDTSYSDCLSTNEKNFSTKTIPSDDIVSKNILQYSGLSTAEFTKPEKYLIAMTEFQVGCDTSPYKLYSEASQSEKSGVSTEYSSTGFWKVKTVISSGKAEDTIWRTLSNRSTSDRGEYGAVYNSNSCQRIVNAANDSAADYRAYIIAHPITEEDTEASTGNNSSGDDDNDTSSASCTIDGIGWLICPVVNFLAGISDASKDKLGEFLQVGSSMFTDRGPGTVYDYWQKILTYANILFVIVFLVVIYSQITGAGISNYGIKKMIPKMIAGVILVNLSFYICALLVDLSNLAGSSAFSFITSIGAGSGSGATTGSWLNQGNTFSDIALGVLAAGATLYFALSALITGLIFVAITAVTTVFLLGIRQALIIFLVITSPLAFVAMLLPNTESLYKKWWSMFKALLFLYPIIGVVYGASSLASHILNPTTSATDPDFLLEIIAAVLMFAPLLLVPTLVKKAMSGFGVTGVIDKLGGKTRGSLSKKAQARVNDGTIARYRENRARQAAATRATVRGGTYTGKNPFQKLNSRFHGGLNKRVLGKYGDKAESMGAKVLDDQDTEDMKMAEARLDNTTFIDTRSDGTKELTKLGQQQHMQIALGQDVTDSTGNIVMPAKNFTSHDRRVAAQRAASIATTSDAIRLAQATSERDPSTGNLVMSASERANISSSLASSKAVARSPYLAGPAIADMQNGTFDLGESVIRAASSGKVTTEALASTDATSSATINDELMRADQSRDDVQQARRNVNAAATEALSPNSRVRQKIIGNNDLHRNIDDMRNL